MELKTSFGVQDALGYRTLPAVTTYILFSFSPTFNPHPTHIHARSSRERSPSPKAAERTHNPLLAASEAPEFPECRSKVD